MSLYDEIIAIYPQLTWQDFDQPNGKILLQDDSDGQGAYIEKWDIDLPLPEGMKIGK